MENKNDAAVIGSKQAPFLNSLAASCASATNFVDDGIHPSLPNYIAATSGDRQGIADDGLPASHQLDVDNIFRQVRATGSTAKSYVESMPKNCSLVSTARYAAKHNPAAYYVGADDRAACARDDVPFDQFAADLAAGLPAFAFVTPDICNDMHDCSVATGDAWLRTQVGLITASPAYRSGSTALFITFDESESHGQAAIPFVAVLPTVVAGTTSGVRLDHYSLLAFTEDALGISTHLGHAAGAASLAGALGL